MKKCYIKIDDIKNDDLKDFVIQYAHSDCDILTNYFHFEHNMDVLSIVADGIPIHHFVKINDEYGFDAYGISKIKNICERYKHLSENKFEILEMNDFDNMYLEDVDIIENGLLLLFDSINIDHHFILKIKKDISNKQH